jgi:hypothetical protein
MDDEILKLIKIDFMENDLIVEEYMDKLSSNELKYIREYLFEVWEIDIDSIVFNLDEIEEYLKTYFY